MHRVECICHEDDVSVQETSVVHAVVVVCTRVSIPKFSVEICCVPRLVGIVLEERLVKKRMKVLRASCA